jgi:hypothetical protein
MSPPRADIGAFVAAGNRQHISRRVDVETFPKGDDHTCPSSLDLFNENERGMGGEDGG